MRLISASRIKIATIWSSIETLTLTLLSLFSMFFLARVLTPEDYGKIAIAQFIAALLQLVLSLGLSDAIIQRKDLDQEDIQTVWLGSLCLSVLCCFICIMVGGCFYYINSQVVSYILYFESINVFFSMVAIVPTALLMRNLEMKKFAYRAIISRLVCLIVAIYLVYNGFGLWSIVYANIVQSFVATILIWLASKHLIPKKLLFNKRKFLALISFGFFSMLENLLWSVISKVFGLLVSMFHGVTAFGLYNMATKLVDTVLNILNGSIARITLPIFSSLQSNRQRLLQAFQGSTYYFNLISMPCFFIMAATADKWILIILGEHWAGLVPVIRIIAIMYGIMYSRIFVGITIKAIGRTREFLLLSFSAAVISLCAVFITKDTNLYITLLVFCILRVLITIPLGAYLMRVLCDFNFIDQFKPLFLPIFITTLLLLVLLFLNRFLDYNNFINFALEAFIVIIIYIIILLILWFFNKVIYRS